MAIIKPRRDAQHIFPLRDSWREFESAFGIHNDLWWAADGKFSISPFPHNYGINLPTPGRRLVDLGLTRTRSPPIQAARDSRRLSRLRYNALRATTCTMHSIKQCRAWKQTVRTLTGLGARVPIGTTHSRNEYMHFSL